MATSRQDYEVDAIKTLFLATTTKVLTDRLESGIMRTRRHR